MKKPLKTSSLGRLLHRENSQVVWLPPASLFGGVLGPVKLGGGPEADPGSSGGGGGLQQVAQAQPACVSSILA